MHRIIMDVRRTTARAFATTTRTTLNSLRRKLHPRGFTAMSPMMAAIVGYILGARYASPAIRSIIVTCDGFLLAVVRDDPRARFVGAYSDLWRKWRGLLGAAELTVEERVVAEVRFARRVGIWGRVDA